MGYENGFTFVWAADCICARMSGWTVAVASAHLVCIVEVLDWFTLIAQSCNDKNIINSLLHVCQDAHYTCLTKCLTILWRFEIVKVAALLTPLKRATCTRCSVVIVPEFWLIVRA